LASKGFETFPFPEGLWQTANPKLAEIGERYLPSRVTAPLSMANLARELEVAHTTVKTWRTLPVPS